MDGGEPFPFVQEIDAFCAENNVVLLYATVTGSRAMGLAGPNSEHGHIFIGLHRADTTCAGWQQR